MNDIFIIDATQNNGDLLIDSSVSYSDLLTAYKSGKPMFLRVIGLNMASRLNVTESSESDDILDSWPINMDILVPLGVAYFPTLSTQQNNEFIVDIVSGVNIDDYHFLPIFYGAYCNFNGWTTQTKCPLAVMVTFAIRPSESIDDVPTLEMMPFPFTVNKYDSDTDGTIASQQQ
jgi:hypothetical protein